jgi:hypothetical protein
MVIVGILRVAGSNSMLRVERKLHVFMPRAYGMIQTSEKTNSDTRRSGDIVKSNIPVWQTPV